MQRSEEPVQVELRSQSVTTGLDLSGDEIVLNSIIPPGPIQSTNSTENIEKDRNGAAGPY